MQLILAKQDIIQALLAVSGAVDRKQSLPILTNVLIKIADNQIIFIATDLEIELQAKTVCQTNGISAEFTVSAKKLIEVVRSFDNESFAMSWDESTIFLQSGHSKFKLATLPAKDFPFGNYDQDLINFSILRLEMYNLLQSVHFAMAQQDVRIFLNSLYIEISDNELKAVAIDGHRLALNQAVFIKGQNSNNLDKYNILIPRRSVIELLRLIQMIDSSEIEFTIGKNYLKITSEKFNFISRLTEAKFPQYKALIPIGHDKIIEVHKDTLKKSLSRIIIITNDKFPVVKLNFSDGVLTLTASNQFNEEVSESIEIALVGEPIDIGVNPYYLLDVLNHITMPQIKIYMKDQDQSILIEPLNSDAGQYVIMPTKL